MHMKRNLTIAALAAMIGVPALGSINANADMTDFYMRQNQKFKHDPQMYDHIMDNLASHRQQIDHAGDPNYQSSNLDDQSNDANNNSDNDTDNSSDEDNNDGTQALSSNKGSASVNQNSDNDSPSENDSKGNQSSKSLPQTGEVSHKTDSIIESILLGASSIGIASLASKKHHNELKGIQSRPKYNNNHKPLDNILQNISDNTNKLNNYINDMNY